MIPRQIYRRVTQSSAACDGYGLITGANLTHGMDRKQRWAVSSLISPCRLHRLIWEDTLGARILSKSSMKTWSARQKDLAI
ncbi:hypothetical protein DPMN_029928 [Dreissena polymorpha]|uniref:Uncharacterized protein n=1 Tax=Dreissena polymorpha TaxID=45954 RepID=A0A9D4RHU4_DREPO|nr:hypothetical protein DPMN_029928 [Dreissena polymorpha]